MFAECNISFLIFAIIIQFASTDSKYIDDANSEKINIAEIETMKKGETIIIPGALTSDSKGIDNAKGESSKIAKPHGTDSKGRDVKKSKKMSQL